MSRERHSPTEPVVLSLVMPAHNEADNIDKAVRDGAATLRQLVDDRYELIVVDDASTDGTADRLDQLARDEPRLCVIRLDQNRGHGPALRTGWEVATGEWVAHLDSDDEIPADELSKLWPERNDTDLLLGVRTGRASPPARRFVTASLRHIVRLMARRPLADANSPCKIVRRSALTAALDAMPRDAFAPSVLLAIHIARWGGTIREIPVTTRERAHGRSWLVPTRLAAGSARAFRDTVMVGTRRTRRTRGLTGRGARRTRRRHDDRAG